MNLNGVPAAAEPLPTARIVDCQLVYYSSAEMASSAFAVPVMASTSVAVPVQSMSWVYASSHEPCDRFQPMGPLTDRCACGWPKFRHAFGALPR